MMVRSRAEYLINKLIISVLSVEEMEELLAGIENEADQENYAAVLADYFDKLVKEQKEEPLGENEIKWLSTLNYD
jgi:hypothetical protein